MATTTDMIVFRDESFEAGDLVAAATAAMALERESDLKNLVSVMGEHDKARFETLNLDQSPKAAWEQVERWIADARDAKEGAGMTTEKWNQVKNGNAYVSDGAVGCWASFPPGTSAKAVLDDYMSTADYSAATGTFTVCAEIEGNIATVVVGPGGEVRG